MTSFFLSHLIYNNLYFFEKVIQYSCKELLWKGEKNGNYILSNS